MISLPINQNHALLEKSHNITYQIHHCNGVSLFNVWLQPYHLPVENFNINWH